MTVVTTAADFTYDDPAEVVAAALCCHWCLTSARVVWLEYDRFGGEAASRCPACRHTSLVLLNHQQLRRLALAPPPSLTVHVGEG